MDYRKLIKDELKKVRMGTGDIDEVKLTSDLGIDIMANVVKNCTETKRNCEHCNSTDVIMFTSDLDICNTCGFTQDGK